jgi:hypothetical protein
MGTQKVLVVEFIRRQNLDELGMFFAAKPSELVTVDRCRHSRLLDRFTRSNVPRPAAFQ